MPSIPAGCVSRAVASCSVSTRFEPAGNASPTGSSNDPGRGRLGRAIAGSVSEAVRAAAACPVHVVHPDGGMEALRGQQGPMKERI
jgi:hypothetical protein